VTLARRSAFLLFGDLPKIGPYLTELRSRGLAILTITGLAESSLERAAAARTEVPGHPFASIDELSRLSGSDHQPVLAQVTEWSDRYAIVGAFSAAETFVEAAALVDDLLGLPGVGLRAARVCRDKYLQRQYLRDWSPRSVLLTSSTAARARELVTDWFPVVVKPTHLYSSIGVRLIADAAQLDAYVAEMQPDARVLVEECVTGPEFSVESIVVAGAPVAASITQKATNEGTTRCFVELAHTAPAADLSEGDTGRIREANAAVIARLDFGTGMTHAEYRVTDSGRVVLMEVAARPGGGGIPFLYHHATGESMEAALIAAALGEKVDYPEPTRAARQVYLDQRPGVLRGVSVTDPALPAPTWVVDTGIWPAPRPGARTDPPTVREILVLKARGEALGTITESSSRAVTLLFDAATHAELDLLEARLRSAVVVDVDGTPSH
jgi:biotin carboxylase